MDQRDKKPEVAGKPCILCCAITGSVPTKDNNPALPVTVAEQIESSHAAVEAGASIIHAHVRDDAGRPCSDPDRFALLQDGLRRHCPGVIVQFSTGGRSGAGQARGGMLPLRPDMASLAVGSNNFPTRVYENPPELIDWLAAEMRAYEIVPEVEAFDLSHILQAIARHKAGDLFGKLYVQFVMGVKNAMPVDRDVFDTYVRLFEARAPEGNWCAAGVGAGQLTVNEWAIAAGGHTRAGLEDNIRLDRDRLAPSNAALIARAAELCEKYERPVATPAEARAILGLRPV
ncbi:BKACE family enzyme [Oceanomicrobium pacificus]|uniref:3-keto-5-aminohexanoate cleavage protein n=1 Tax=Oceanomicrobium pacificus TaxID=2692916 RepID=A0A6B0TMV7_9RHOB|nr:3-keto-5-aminohexanoate cleavage protein [Oceanomicrobium pacificus]MXU65186.1 3-keto-5-aminohexanoate cleavage protein [Oceanomicrobium pacificus]